MIWGSCRGVQVRSLVNQIRELKRADSDSVSYIFMSGHAFVTFYGFHGNCDKAYNIHCAREIEFVNGKYRSSLIGYNVVTPTLQISTTEFLCVNVTGGVLH